MIILYLFLITRSVRSDIPSKTAVAIKEGLEDYSNPIPTGISSFKELLKNSKLFIDTTLLIHDILEGGDPILILGSQGWGRSINLDMLKTFLELQVNPNGEKIVAVHSSNYNLFVKTEIIKDDGIIERLQNPLLIAAQEAIVTKYLGQHPVIYINFNDTIGQNFTTVKLKMAQAIARTYKQHDYIGKAYETALKVCKREGFRKYNQRMLSRFQDYLHARSSELSISVEFLAKLLHEHFNKKIFILIDDYDKPLHSIFKTENFPKFDGDKVLTFLNKFLERVLNHTSHVKQYIIVGTLETDIAAWKPFIPHHVYGRKGLLHEYFGFKSEHVKFLFDTIGIDAQQSKQAQRWYDGYESKFFNFNFYNPVSTACFLTHRQIAPYGVYNRIIPFIQNALHKSSKHRRDIRALISKQQITYKLSIHPEKMVRNLSLVWENDGSLSVRGKQLFILYLIRESYLMEIPNPDPLQIDKANRFKLPNSEVAFVMAHWLVSYYKTQYNIKEKHLQNAAVALHDFIKSETKQERSLRKSLKNLYKNSDYNVTDTLRQKAYPVLSILNCVALRMQNLTQFQMDVYYDRIQTADIVIIDLQMQQEIIIEVTTEEQLDTRTYQYKSFSDTTRTLILVGVHVTSDRNVGIAIQSTTV